MVGIRVKDLLCQNIERKRMQVASGEEALARARLEAAKEVSAVKVEAANSSRELAATYDARLASMREEADKRRKAVVLAIEDAKAAEIQVGLFDSSRGSCWGSPLVFEGWR